MLKDLREGRQDRNAEDEGTLGRIPTGLGGPIRLEKTRAFTKGTITKV